MIKIQAKEHYYFDYIKDTYKNKELKDFLKQIRLMVCLTQEQFGRLYKINRSLVQKYEYGITKPRPERLVMILHNLYSSELAEAIFNMLIERYYLDKKRKAEPKTKVKPS